MTPSEIKTLRESWGLSQIALARLLRVRPETMNRYERGVWDLPEQTADYLRSLELNPRHRAAMLKERGCIAE